MTCATSCAHCRIAAWDGCCVPDMHCNSQDAHPAVPPPLAATEEYKEWSKGLQNFRHELHTSRMAPPADGTIASSKLAKLSAKIRTAILNNADLSFWKATLAGSCKNSAPRWAAGHAHDASVAGGTQDEHATEPALCAVAPASADNEAPPVVRCGDARKVSSRKRPAWALSGGQAEDAEEQELLHFAQQLDFDDFVQAMDQPRVVVEQQPADKVSI